MPDSEFSDRSPWAVFLVFLRLGLTSFGGPVAHLGYFREELVVRRRWLSERNYADLVALCQFLPGPASSQVGMALGLARAGYPGALAAWLGFTLPSAVALILFALGLAHWGDAGPAGLLHGLKVVAVAVVAQAVWGMARSLCPDAPRTSLMAVAACAVLWWSSAWAQVLVLALAALVGLWMLAPGQGAAHEPLPIPVGRRAGMAWLALFVALLLGLPWAAAVFPHATLAVADAFYRAGALVFGGGHVVLPLLEAAVVREGWLAADGFMAVYGLAQAVPGPMFSLAAGLGAQVQAGALALAMGVLALLAVFLPGFLLLLAALPAWGWLVAHPRALGAVAGLNAVVVGLLAAALAGPLWTQGVRDGLDLAVVAVGFALLQWGRVTPLAVVLGCVAATLLRVAVTG